MLIGRVCGSSQGPSGVWALAMIARESPVEEDPTKRYLYVEWKPNAVVGNICPCSTLDNIGLSPVVVVDQPVSVQYVVGPFSHNTGKRDKYMTFFLLVSRSCP